MTESDERRIEWRPRLASIGVLMVGCGGLLLAVTSVASLSRWLAAAGAALFIGGLLTVALGGGLSTAWDVLKSMLP